MTCRGARLPEEAARIIESRPLKTQGKAAGSTLGSALGKAVGLTLGSALGKAVGSTLAQPG